MRGSPLFIKFINSRSKFPPEMKEAKTHSEGQKTAFQSVDFIDAYFKNIEKQAILATVFTPISQGKEKALKNLSNIQNSLE